MFASSKGAALGMAVLSAGASVPAGARAATAAPVPPARACATRGLTRADVARGEQSVVHCAPTREEAIAAALGDEASVMATGPVTAQAGFVAGVLLTSDNLNDTGLTILGDCSVQMRNLAPPWRDDISGFRMGGCSTIKLFTGDQLDGTSGVFAYGRYSGTYGLTGTVFNNRVHSVAFKD